MSTGVLGGVSGLTELGMPDFGPCVTAVVSHAGHRASLPINDGTGDLLLLPETDFSSMPTTHGFRRVTATGAPGPSEWLLTFEALANYVSYSPGGFYLGDFAIQGDHLYCLVNPHSSTATSVHNNLFKISMLDGSIVANYAITGSAIAGDIATIQNIRVAMSVSADETRISFLCPGSDKANFKGVKWVEWDHVNDIKTNTVQLTEFNINLMFGNNDDNPNPAYITQNNELFLCSGQYSFHWLIHKTHGPVALSSNDDVAKEILQYLKIQTGTYVCNNHIYLWRVFGSIGRNNSERLDTVFLRDKFDAYLAECFTRLTGIDV